MHVDFLKTVASETSSEQTVSATKQYDAFGLPASATGSSSSVFGFAGGWGYQEDPDSGLKLLGHRYYDPSTGRFLTRDPAKDGRNWYAYCENNPIRNVDPEGLQDLILPDDPSGLPDGWTRLPHRDPKGGSRWMAPGGEDGLEFHPADPNAKKGTYGSKPHWHRLKRGGPKRKWKKQGEHYMPGDEIHLEDVRPVEREPSIWSHFNWSEAGRRTAIVGGVVVVAALVAASGGTLGPAVIGGGGSILGIGSQLLPQFAR